MSVRNLFCPVAAQCANPKSFASTQHPHTKEKSHRLLSIALVLPRSTLVTSLRNPFPWSLFRFLLSIFVLSTALFSFWILAADLRTLRCHGHLSLLVGKIRKAQWPVGQSNCAIRACGQSVIVGSDGVSSTIEAVGVGVDVGIANPRAWLALLNLGTMTMAEQSRSISRRFWQITRRSLWRSPGCLAAAFTAAVIGRPQVLHPLRFADHSPKIWRSRERI